MIRIVWPLVVAAVSLATTAGAIGLGVTAFTAAYAAAGPFLSRILVGRPTRTALLSHWVRSTSATSPPRWHRHSASS